MLKYLQLSCLFLLALVGLSSCEKVIEVDLKSSPVQLVFEGNITNVLGPQYIKISRSVPYSDSNVYPPVTGATVVVTNQNGANLPFTEVQPGLYSFRALKGQPKDTYTMKATVDNVVYTASSTMPSVVRIDSLTIKSLTFGGDENRQVEVNYTDPIDIVNQYRFLLKINNVLTRRIFADDDRLNNGNKVSNILFYTDDDNKDIELGDRIEVELQCIDKDVFKYWSTLSQQTQNGPGGGVTPGNPPSNINNNALGYFSAHTTFTRSFTMNY